MKVGKAVGNKTLEVGWGWGSNDVQEGLGTPFSRHPTNGIQEEMGCSFLPEP